MRKNQWFLSSYVHAIFHCHVMRKLAACLYTIDSEDDVDGGVEVGLSCYAQTDTS